MKIVILTAFTALLFSANAFAHQAFTLVSSAKKIITAADLVKLEANQTPGKKDQANLIFTDSNITLVVITGPEDDMLSYRIQGLRNPNLVVPTDAKISILFVNTDNDMPHDIRFGHVMAEFTVAPAVAETAGTTRLEYKAETGALNAEEIVIKPTEDGAYKYFCSIRGHAKGGMWGNILVGVEPGANLKIPEKMPHNHFDNQNMQMNEPQPKEDEEKPGMPMDHKNHQNIGGMQMGGEKTEEKSQDMSGMSNMPGMNHGASMEMRSTINLAEPMTRESSGTAWVPDSSPMYARMKMYENGDMLMLHGNMFFRYTNVGSSRDVSIGGKGSRRRFDAPSMFMAMYSHQLNKKSQIGFRLMMSLDPIIERGYGYPLLYQSGEAYRGRPIHDRQHPHDFFSELAVTYSYKFNEKQSMFFYAGYPGEPALGPPTFMHRLSAMDNPDAPLSHHWQDSTHITFGVVTAGYVFNKFKIEASAFKGQVPDENRWNFDKPKLDSFSGRISFNPTKEWSFQISHGYLKNPEPAEPEIRVRRRTTASAIYNKNFGDDRNWANSLVWGQNHDDEGRTNAFLFETNYQFKKNSIFSRLERVQKSSHELVLPAPHPEGNFWVGSYSIGYIRDLIRDKGLDLGLGAKATLYTNPASLSPFYGGTQHGGFQIFFRIRPSRMKH